MEARTVVLTVGVLSFSQALLGQFMIHGVPLFLRDAGHPAETVALTYVAAIPFALRFVWGPLIDRYGSVRWGPFGTWILGGQLASLVLLTGLAIADPAGRVAALIAAMVLTMVAVGTQQTATSGFMIRHLQASRFASGAAAQAVGSTSAGVLLGLGVIYLLGDFGWTAVVAALALLSAAVFVAVLTRLPLDRGHSRPAARISLASQFAIFGKPDARRLFLVSLLVAFAAVLPYGFKSILLIDAGFSVAESGLIGIVFGNAAGLLAALTARPLVERFGGWRVLAAVGLIGAAVAAGTAALAAAGLFGPGMTVALVLVSNGVVYAGFTANRSLLMGLCGDGRQATDFATFASIEAIAVLLVAGGGTAVLDHIGLAPMLLACSVVSLGGVWAAQRLSLSAAYQLPKPGTPRRQ